MNALGQRRLLAGAAGLGVALVAAWIVLSGDRSESPAEASDDPSQPSATPGTASGPDVPPVDPCSMLELDQIDDALGLAELPTDQRSFFTMSGGEACTWQHDPGSDAEGASVGVHPGVPEDFLPGAEVDGSVAEPVSGIGDAAAWFEAADRGVLSVVTRTSLGYLFVRVTVNRPDIDDAGRQSVARMVAGVVLPQFPGMQPTAGEPEEVTIQHESPDVSNVSLALSVLAREEAGEWSRGDGLVAALRLIAGEATQGEVLEAADLVDVSGTGVIAMAQEFLEQAPADAAAAEIERLLDLLTALPGDDAGLGRDGDVVLAANRGQVAQGEHCGSEEPTEPGWTVVSAHEDAGQGEWQHVAFFPAGGGGGWVADTHLAWAVEAMERSAEYLDPEAMPCIHLIFASAGGLDSYVADSIVPEICAIFVNPPMRSRPEERFKQRIALEVVHCTIPTIFPEQVGVAGYESRLWWNHALAWFLSNEIYTDIYCPDRCDLEWQFAQPLAAQELALSLVDRVETNWLFFQHIANTFGDEGLGELIGALPPSAAPEDHEAALAGFDGMAEAYHDFARRLSDASVEDSGSGVVPYVPPSDRVHLGGPVVIIDEPQAFGMTRLHLMVDAGQYACIEHDVSSDVTLSWRPGAPGPGSASGWSPGVPNSLNDDAVVIATTTQPGGSLTLVVVDVDDQQDCPDQEQQAPPLDPCTEDVCGQSAYYRSPEDLPESFEEPAPSN